MVYESAEAKGRFLLVGALAVSLPGLVSEDTPSVGHSNFANVCDTEK